ncbi:AMP-binding protein [Streptomyces sp. NPDC050625]|uniref:class I adenylate-forming enzyme family protein n=1 Tax=Streptomyces sp. NPDC050625 TaxID=3154629 RepID=UPI0034483F54
MTKTGITLDPVTGTYQWSETGLWETAPEIPLAETLIPLIRGRADRPMISFEDGVQVTNAQMLERAARLAGWLVENVPAGRPIGVCMGNRAEFFVVFFAVLTTGHAMVNMNPASRAVDAAHMIDDSDAYLLICDEENVETLRGLIDTCPGLTRVYQVEGPEPDGLSGLYGDIEPRELLADPPALTTPITLSYTSGTTGKPKGCVHVQGGYLRYADVNGRVYDIDENDTIFNPLQFFYGDAIWMMCVSIITGARFASMRKFSVSRYWTAVKETGATVMVGIGSIPNLLLKRTPGPDERDHAMRLAIQVGIPVKQHAELEERYGFPWLDAYGLSETGPNLLMPPDLADQYVGSGALGIPAPGLETVLLDPDGNEVEGPGVGELAVFGPYMIPGYLNKPEETAQIRYKENFYRTGDMHQRDEKGIYYFRGRIKEIIRRGGENIAPFEVEEVLRLHPDVTESAVVPVEDELMGEEVKAYVLAKENGVDLADLVEFARHRLAPHKVPRYLELRTEPFPRTPSQRIKKADLMVDGRHTTDNAWDRTETPA